MTRLHALLFCASSLYPQSFEVQRPNSRPTNWRSYSDSRTIIVLTASHQSLDTMSALFRFEGKIPKHLRRTAVYEITACAAYEEKNTSVKLSTARIRSEFATAGLFLNSPVLNLITVDADASTARTLLELGTGLAPGGSFAAVVASSNEYVRAAAFGGSLVLSLLGRSKQRPIAITDPGHLDVDKGCASYLTLAKWPSKGYGKEFATVTVLEWKEGGEGTKE